MGCQTKALNSWAAKYLGVDKNYLWTSGSSVIVSILGLTPHLALTAFYGLDFYGSFASLLALATLCVFCCDLRLGDLVIVWHRSSTGTSPEIAGAVTVAAGGSSIASFLLIYIVGGQLFADELGLLMALSLLAVGQQVFVPALVGACRAQEEFGKAGIIRVFLVVCRTGLFLLAILRADNASPAERLECFTEVLIQSSIAWLAIVVMCALAVIKTYAPRKIATLRPKAHLLRREFRRIALFYTSNLGAAVTKETDVLIASSLLDTSTVGAYRLIKFFVAFPWLMLEALAQNMFASHAWQPKSGVEVLSQTLRFDKSMMSAWRLAAIFFAITTIISVLMHLGIFSTPDALDIHSEFWLEFCMAASILVIWLPFFLIPYTLARLGNMTVLAISSVITILLVVPIQLFLCQEFGIWGLLSAFLAGVPMAALVAVAVEWKMTLKQ